MFGVKRPKCDSCVSNYGFAAFTRRFCFTCSSRGCPCHEWLRKLVVDANLGYSHSDDAKQLDRVRKLLGLKYGEGDGTGFSPCPNSGRRAVELALGGLETFFEQVVQSHVVALLAICQYLTDADREIVNRSFNVGKAYMLTYLRLKLDFWTKLPWRLVGLAHWHETTAREAARKIIELFNISPHDGQLHHRITWLWLSPSGHVRGLLNRFAAGEPLAALPTLASMIWEFLFIPITERIQEADHGLVSNETVKRKVTGPYVSLV